MTAVNLNDGPEAGGGAWASVQCTSRLFGEGAARQALGAAGALLDGGGVISVQALNKALADCVRGARMGWSEAASFLSGIGALGGSASGASPVCPFHAAVAGRWRRVLRSGNHPAGRRSVHGASR